MSSPTETETDLSLAVLPAPSQILQRRLLPAMDITSLSTPIIYHHFEGLPAANDFCTTWPTAWRRQVQNIDRSALVPPAYRFDTLSFSWKDITVEHWYRPNTGKGEYVTQLIACRFLLNRGEDPNGAPCSKPFTRCELIVAYQTALQIAYRRHYICRQWEDLIKTGTIDIEAGGSSLDGWQSVMGEWVDKANSAYCGLALFLAELNKIEGNVGSFFSFLFSRGRSYKGTTGSSGGSSTECEWDIYSILNGILEDPCYFSPFPPEDVRNLTISHINQAVLDRYQELLPKQENFNPVPHRTFVDTWELYMVKFIHAGKQVGLDWGDFNVSREYLRAWHVLNFTITREIQAWKVAHRQTLDEPPRYEPEALPKY